jgi:PIN domain nuclease of toxin-antitoxin system
LSGILIDTHFLYWWMTADPRMGAQTRCVIESEDICVSVASQWEMILRHARGKLPLPDAPLASAIEREGFRIVPVRPEHVDAVRSLEGGLDDPFDRLLVATALVERMTLLTRDRAILKFGRTLPQAAVREG